MTQNKNCSKCGNEFLAANETDSACPKCLAKFVMEPTQLNSQSPSGIENEPFLPAGAKIGQYEIKVMLGRGGMGTVYKAFQPMLERFVAIKILPAKLAVDQEFTTRFNREAKALAGLSHPNIVGIYDIGQESGHFYFVMEFIEGVTVRELMAQGKLPAQEALKIVPQLCEALEYAHSEGVIHRDIKPENIMIDKKGRVKIADFGLARIIRGDVKIDPVTRTQEVMGTLDYMAPEQRMKSKDVDLRVDIYSLGVVFYEMLTGELPIGKFEVPSRKVQIDVRIDDIVMKTLEREPSKRYQRVSEVGKAVTEVLAGVSKSGSMDEDDKKMLDILGKVIPEAVKSGNASQSGAKYSTLSILSLALSFIPACITQLLGIIFGIVAIRKINRSAGQLKGTGLAIAGIVISMIVGMTVVPILLAIAIPNFLSNTADRISAVDENISEIMTSKVLQKLALAQELSYKADFFGGNYSESVKKLCEFPSMEVVLGPDVKLIAQADQGALGNDAKPYQGYFFKMVPYEIIDQKPYFPGSPFTLAAYPAGSGKTFICDERRIIYSKDLGPVKYPDKWKSKIGANYDDYDPTRDGWKGEGRVEISDENLKDAYKKMRTALLTPEDKAVIEKLKTSKISADILRKPSRLKDVLDFISKELNIRIEDIRTGLQVDKNNQEVSIPALWFDGADLAPAETILKMALMAQGNCSYFVKYGKIIVCNPESTELPLYGMTLEDGISFEDRNRFANLMMEQAARILEQKSQDAKVLLETISHLFPTYNDELDRRYEQLDNKILAKLGYMEYLESGKKLMAQGKYQEALNAFTHAQGIHYTPGVKVMIGQCQEEIKKQESEQKPK